ncbi:hypothetical protein [Streptomyces sp. NPDC057729]|uniref:hypothetical protein n=1 Tax=Streptomyces sp. NPDC057729 TaxID=3346230 RepID=UPI0036CF6233
MITAYLLPHPRQHPVQGPLDSMEAGGLLLGVEVQAPGGQRPRRRVISAERLVVGVEHGDTQACTAGVGSGVCTSSSRARA